MSNTISNIKHEDLLKYADIYLPTFDPYVVPHKNDYLRILYDRVSLLQSIYFGLFIRPLEKSFIQLRLAILAETGELLEHLRIWPHWKSTITLTKEIVADAIVELADILAFMSSVPLLAMSDTYFADVYHKVLNETRNIETLSVGFEVLNQTLYSHHKKQTRRIDLVAMLTELATTNPDTFQLATELLLFGALMHQLPASDIRQNKQIDVIDYCKYKYDESMLELISYVPTLMTPDDTNINRKLLIVFLDKLARTVMEYWAMDDVAKASSIVTNYLGLSIQLVQGLLHELDKRFFDMRPIYTFNVAVMILLTAYTLKTIANIRRQLAKYTESDKARFINGKEDNDIIRDYLTELMTIVPEQEPSLQEFKIQCMATILDFIEKAFNLSDKTS